MFRLVAYSSSPPSPPSARRVSSWETCFLCSCDLLHRGGLSRKRPLWFLLPLLYGESPPRKGLFVFLRRRLLPGESRHRSSFLLVLLRLLLQAESLLMKIVFWFLLRLLRHSESRVVASTSSRRVYSYGKCIVVCSSSSSPRRTSSYAKSRHWSSYDYSRRVSLLVSASRRVSV